MGTGSVLKMNQYQQMHFLDTFGTAFIYSPAQ